MSSEAGHVVVMGGGVAGLTCAHELLQRGFRVTLFERRAILGGKSRSFDGQMLDPSGDPQSKTVPAEHGFRFIPGFYRHLDDTFSRISIGGRTVKDNLKPISEELLGVPGKALISFPAAAPARVDEIRSFLRFPDDLLNVGLTRQDLEIFAAKLWQVATSCRARRDEEYEGIGWREFIGSLNRSDEYYWYLASGLTRTLVAARASQASTKTMGNIALQLWSCLTERGNTTDRVLNGPTNEVWFEPWKAYLSDKYGDVFRVLYGCEVTSIQCAGNKVVEVSSRRISIPNGRGEVADKGEGETVRADYFISALPVEVLAGLISKNETLRQMGGQQFDNIVTLAKEDVVSDPTLKETEKSAVQRGYLRWMNGIQIYFKRDVRFNRGHQIFLNSPWGLTSISQRQFWEGWPDGIGGILSVDISSWDVAGLNGKAARECTKPEIFQEVLRQLREVLGGDGLGDDNILGWYLDEAIVGPNFATSRQLAVDTANLEPILVNQTGSWALRPTANTKLENFFLAGDFVQTATDLACMEGANEAARRAVNFLVAKRWGDSDAKPAGCQLFTPAEPPLLAPLRDIDAQRFKQGLPWSGLDFGKWMVRGVHAAGALGNLAFADELKATPSVSNPNDERVLQMGSLVKRAGPARVPSSQTLPKPVEVRALSVEQVLNLRKASSPGREDPMFKRWRLFNLPHGDRQYQIPFQVFDADSLVIHGQATNYAALAEWTKGTGYIPAFALKGADKVGFAELWVMRYTDTISGPYNEIVINFVVSKRERKYRYRSQYSSLVPMMDPDNRLFTVRLLLQELGDRGPRDIGPIQYGKELFGTDKRPATVEIGRAGDVRTFSWSEADEVDRELVSGEVRVTESVFGAAADLANLSQELGVTEALKNVRQGLEGSELKGGLVTLDNRVAGNSGKTVEVLAVYKFAPKLQLVGEDLLKYKRDPNPRSFAWLLSHMGFVPMIASYDPHLKSILYLDSWPNPDRL